MMENSNKQIQNELLPLSDKSNTLCQYLMNEKGYINDSFNKIQYYFGDQEAGIVISNQLTQAMRELQCAYCELEQLKGSIIEFVRILAN